MLERDVDAHEVEPGGIELVTLHWTSAAHSEQSGVFWTPTLSLFDRIAHDFDLAHIKDHRPRCS